MAKPVRPRDVSVPGVPAIAGRVWDGGADPGGPPVVLLHGLGRTLEDWSPLAAVLARRHPVYAVDLRGHGLSGDGALSLEGMVDDLIRMLGHFDLERPVIVGHALGGMVAAAAGTRRSDLTAVVNIEGHGWPRPGAVATRLGLSPEEAVRHIARLRAFVVDQLAALLAPMPCDAFESMLAALRDEPLGMSGAALEASALRACVAADGVVSPRPGPRAVRALYAAAADEFDPDRVYRRLVVPALVLVATDPFPAPPGAPMRFGDIIAAQVEHELAPRGGTDVRVRGVPAGHAMHLSHPERVATLVEDFLAAA